MSLKELGAAFSLVKTDSKAAFDMLTKSLESVNKNTALAIISQSGLSQEEQKALAIKLGLISVEEAESRAALQNAGSHSILATMQNMASTAALGLQNVLKGLWATMMANPLTALITVATLVISLISIISRNVKQARENARQATYDAASAAQEETDSINALYTAYQNANSAYKNNAGSKEELTNATDSLLSALGYEKGEIDDLIDKYGSLDAAIVKTTNDALSDDRAKQLSAASTKQEEWVDHLKSFSNTDGYGYLYHSNAFSSNIDKDLSKIMFGSGMVIQDYQGNVKPAIDMGADGLIDTYEEAVAAYNKYIELRDYITENKGDYTTEELTSSKLYTDLSTKITNAEEYIKEVSKYYQEADKLQAQIDANNYFVDNQAPKTQKEANDIVRQMVDAAQANKEYVGTEEERRNAVLATLDAMSQFDNFKVEYVSKSELDSIDKLKRDIGAVGEARQELSDWVDGLSDDEYSIVTNIAANTDTADWDLQHWKDRVEAELKIQTPVTLDIGAETESLSQINEMIQSSMTGTGLSTVKDGDKYVNQLDKIKDRYKDIEGYDAEKLFQRTANGIKVNQKEAARLEEEYENLKKTDLQEHLDALKDKYNLLTEEMNTCDDAAEMANLRAQRDDVLNEIDTVSELATQYEGLTSAYQKWQEAKSGADERDAYSNIGEAYEGTKDLIKQGWVADTEVTEYLDLLLNADQRTKDNVKDFDLLTKKIGGTKFSIMDFFQYDDDDNLVSDGLFNFFDTVKAELGEEYVQIDEAGNYAFDFTGKKIDDVAEKLGMSTEAVQILERAMIDAGFDVMFDSTFSNVEGLISTSQEAIKTLKDLQEAGDIKTDVSGFNVKSNDLSDITTQLETAKDLLKEFTNEDGTVNLKMKGAQEAQTILASLIYRKHNLENPALMSVEVDTSDAASEIDKALDLMQRFKKASAKLDVQAQMGVDTTDAKKEVDGLLEKMKTNKTITTDLSIDTSSADKALATINESKPQLWVKMGLDSSKVDGYVETDKTSNGLVVWDNEDSKVNSFINQKHIAPGTINWGNNTSKVKTKFEATGTVNWKNKSQANGTAHNQGIAQDKGTAFAQGKSGDWSIGGRGTALVGELGQELVVRNGKFFTIGDESAEFFNYQPNDIIFNAEQTRQIFANGRITNGVKRGIAYAEGSAFDSGSGGKRRKVSESTAKKSSSSSSKNNSSSSKSESSSTKGKNALENFQDWFSKLFDWIEIKLERQTDKIESYVKKADSALDSGNYNKSATNYVNAIAATAVQVNNEKTASSKYNSQANKILNTAIKKGLVSQKTANNIKKKVQNGSMNISEYSDKVQEVIKSYQEWYDKSKTASNAITNLQNNIRDYINTLKEVRDAQRDALIDQSEIRQSIGTGGFTSSSGGYYGLKNNQLSYTNIQIKNQNAAYQTATDGVSDDVNLLRSKSKSDIGSALKSKTGKKNKTYNKALKNAQSAIKSKKKIASSDLSTISKYNTTLYQNLYAYNLQLDNYETALYEKATAYAANSSEIYQNIAETYENIDDATNNNMSLYQQKSDNAATASSKNSYLSKIALSYDTISSNNQKEIDQYSKDVSANQKTIAKSNGSHYNTQYTALNANGRQYVNNVIDTAQKAAKAGTAIPPATISKLATYYSKRYISYAFYKACIDYNNALEMKREAEAQKAIDEETAKAEKAALGAEMISNIEQEYQNKLDANQRTTTEYKTVQALKNARRQDLNEKDYQNLINQSKARQLIYSAEADAIEAQIQRNLNSGLWTTSSQEYKDALQTLADYRDEVQQCIIDQEELKVSLRDDVYWRTYERAHDAAKRLENVLSGINNLISNEMIYDSDGNLTEYGLAQLSLLSQEYQDASQEAKNYSDDIDNLNKLYKDGYYTEQEYLEKLDELEQGVLSSASSMKSSMYEIMNIYKNIEQNELNSLFKVIDARKKALDAKKNYYDYDKTIKSKNKDIQFLQAQLSALEGVEGLEARAKRAELQAQLSESQEDLNDTIQEHQYELSQDALDDLKDTMQEAFDDRWADIYSDLDAITELMSTANDLIKDSTQDITSSIGELLSSLGVTPSAQDAINGTITRKGYASGTTSVPKDMLAWTQEHGDELIVRKSDGAIFTPLQKGDGVIPNNLTQRLYELAQLNPHTLIKNVDRSQISSIVPLVPNIEISQHFDNLLNVEGNVDSTVITDLEQFAKQFYKGSYEYTTREIIRDAKKMGIK